MHRRTILASALLLGAACVSAGPAQARSGGRLVYFGTHGNAIFAARFDPSSGALTSLGQVAELERPTWLIASPVQGIVYSVSETGNDGKSQASVHAFRVDATTGALRALGSTPSGGGGATHLAIDPRSRTLFAANYGTGQASAIPIARDGTLGAVASVQADHGTGPHRRQASPHAHGVTVSPDGRYLLVPDLGADRVFVYRFDAASRALAPNDPPFAQAAAGSGPRHAIFLPGGRFAYVNSELTGQITTYAWDAAAGRLTPVETLSTQAPNYTGEKSAAEMAASRDGRFVYVSNRGEDTIVVYRVDRGTGRLSEIQRLPSGGKVPWSFTLDPGGRWLLVTNEASSTVTTFRVDPATGRLAAVGEPLSVPKPVSAVFPDL